MKGAEGPGRVGERVTVCSGAAVQRCSGAAAQGGAAAQQFRAVQRRSAPRHRPAAPPLARVASSRASTATSRRPACGCSRPPARASSPGAPEASFSAKSRLRLPSGQPRPHQPLGRPWPGMSGLFSTQQLAGRSSSRRAAHESSSPLRTCNHMCQRLQPYVPGAATTCARGCNHVPEAATPCSSMPAARALPRQPSRRTSPRRPAPSWRESRSCGGAIRRASCRSLRASPASPARQRASSTRSFAAARTARWCLPAPAPPRPALAACRADGK